MNASFLKALPYIATALLCCGALYSAYRHGVVTTTATWQAEWNARDTRDALAKEQNEAAERVKEQDRQQALNKVVRNGQALIDTATAAAAVANHESDSLRRSSELLAKRITSSQTGGHSCTAATSAAAARAVMVFSELLNRVDQRAGDLAGFADASYSRGVTCEQAYDALAK